MHGGNPSPTTARDPLDSICGMATTAFYTLGGQYKEGGEQLQRSV
jgi:hypothetical protein